MAQETTPIIIGELKGADFNTTADQNIPIAALRYIIRRIVVENASVSLTLAAGGIYTGAGKTGTIIVPATQLYAVLTVAAKYLDLTLTAIIGTDVRTEGTLFFSLTTAQGSTALADIRIFGDVLP
jgi:hypothetical protein